MFRGSVGARGCVSGMWDPLAFLYLSVFLVVFGVLDLEWYRSYLLLLCVLIEDDPAIGSSALWSAGECRRLCLSVRIVALSSVAW